MKQVASVYHRKVGNILVSAICDGYLDTSYGIFQGITPQEGEKLMADACLLSPPRISVNAYLVRCQGRVALIETGSGNSMGLTLGYLADNIRAAGLALEDIEKVLLTHMHPDHSNGLTTDEGARIYPNAEIALHEDEFRHWTSDAEMARVELRKQDRYFRAARKHLQAYKDQLSLFTEGEVFPGVMAMPIAGHTPGHTAYLIASGNDALMIWGDLVHVPNIQLTRPDVTLDFDSDPQAACTTRKRILDMVAADQLLVGGMHLDFPGFGHISREGAGYRFHPEPWKPLI
ncbi:MBL fold metallo-hydrolase [Salinicola sp. MIT1003]|uniref:MBL fold metallo-hydrolase n=1 Tax=Salinicola sp. MIT1003 TaxID=1882734 RepID=UPI0008DC9943|nr:MBL fold metallo-hydrolase [Salinicola sp. MIT1003]OHZ00439.1 hypothetical protein BC443_16710 [Salinicola sp. MIT1003]